ncbi:MAG: hypothetical protein HYT14_02700 [Candidatus Liptonbacteria bacterium]|nr:hypothetical protein [Candidatus Liptonbacteria bacterium]
MLGKKIDLMQENFLTGLGHAVPRTMIVGEITRYMREDAGCHYQITIGSDSELLPDKSADFVTAIVVHRVGGGGRYFWRRLERENFHTLRDRIIQEVLLSIEVAKELIEELRAADQAAEGETGETKVMIQEVVGMIRANNFEAKTKPWSYAASKVADRHV